MAPVKLCFQIKQNAPLNYLLQVFSADFHNSQAHQRAMYLSNQQHVILGRLLKVSSNQKQCRDQYQAQRDAIHCSNSILRARAISFQTAGTELEVSNPR